MGNPIPNSDAREALGEALFALSDRLRKIGALDSDNVHAAYETVVTRFRALSDQPDSTNEGLAELLRLAEDCAAELEAEVRHRWGDDIRLAHKVERDLATAVELRKAIDALSTGRQA